jgi:hypothetical protein
MVEAETSNPPSPADSPPRVDTVSPGAELEEGLEEVPAELYFPEDDESNIELEDPNKFEDAISQGTADTLAILKPGDVGRMQPFDESCCLCRITVKS